MNTYMTEEEQVEAIKKWWAQYGNNLMTAILIVLMAVVGWKWYQRHEYTKKAQASVSYEKLIQNSRKADKTLVAAEANYLLENYPATVYAKSAALVLARQAVIAGQYDEAIKQLNWVRDKAKQPALRQVARLRLARILSSQKKYSQAFSQLKVIEDKNYAALIDEVKGDIYFAENKKAEAKNAYLAAKKQFPSQALVPSELQMKLFQVSFEKAQAVSHALSINQQST